MKFYFLGCFPNHTKYILLFKNACVSIYLQFDAYIYLRMKSCYRLFLPSFECLNLLNYQILLYTKKNCDYSTNLISGESMHRCCIQIKIVFVLKLSNKISLSKKSYIYIFFLLTRYKSYLFYQNFII